MTSSGDEAPVWHPRGGSFWVAAAEMTSSSRSPVVAVESPAGSLSRSRQCRSDGEALWIPGAAEVEKERRHDSGLGRPPQMPLRRPRRAEPVDAVDSEAGTRRGVAHLGRTIVANQRAPFR